MTHERENLVWHDNSGHNYTMQEVSERLANQTANFNQKIHIGTDSHRGRKSKHIGVATVICLWSENVRGGGWYCFNRHFTPMKSFKSLYDRLFHEVQMSVEAASFVRDELGLAVDAIHIDVNPKETELSSKYAMQLSGYVEAYGFKCVMKPDSWAASGVADKHAR